jgi:iron-sulfur cluster assembly protein
VEGRGVSGGDEEVEGSADVPKRQPTTTTTTKRRPMVKRDPLIITPAAAARIAHLIDAHNSSGGRGGSGSGSDARAVGIRLGTKKRGCNGLSYTLNYAYSDHASHNPRDEVMIISIPSAGNGLRVYVEPMALMNVIGTTMDFADDEMSSEFTFTNPNSKGECGCGESFNV